MSSGTRSEIVVPMIGAWIAAGVLVGMLLARRQSARRLASLPPEGADRVAAFDAARTRVSSTIWAAAVVGAAAGIASAWIADGSLSPWDTSMFAMLTASCAATLSSVPFRMDVEERVRGPGWDRASAQRVAAWATFGASGAVPCAGAMCAAFVSIWTSSQVLIAESFAIGSLAALMVQARLFTRVGVVGPPLGGAAPDESALAAATEQALALAGPGVRPDVRLWRTGEGVWNAFATGGWRTSRILVSDDIPRLLGQDELTAVLLHEIGHTRLRHVAWRKATLLASILGAPAALAAVGCARPGAMFLAAMLVLVGAAALYRRQEFEADAFARDRGEARALGRALIAMERAHMLPADRAHATTHPLLRRRLEALGVSDLLPPAPAAA